MDGYDAIFNFCHKNYLFPFSIIASGKHKTNRLDGFGNTIYTRWKLVLTICSFQKMQIALKPNYGNVNRSQPHIYVWKDVNVYSV